MKHFAALSLALACTAAVANDCESSNQLPFPGAAAKRVPRAKPRPAPVAAPVVGPKLYLTPYVPTRPFAPVKPRVNYKTVTGAYSCPPPMSLPPGVIRIGYSVPYVGPRPEWGSPPSFLPVGPMPVWPGSPNDFPPGLIIPPNDLPPGPTDVPEPSVVALMALGLLALRKVHAKKTAGIQPT